MNFRSIWTIKGMSFPERVRRTRDWFAMFIAKLLPLRVRYWTVMIAIGKATMNSPNIPSTPLDYILKNLHTPKDLR